MIGSYARLRIPSEYVELSQIADLLSKQVQGLNPGDMFLLSTNLIERQSRIRSMRHNEDEDVIVSTHYLGIADVGDEFVYADTDSVLAGKLSLKARSFVDNRGIEVRHEPIELYRMSVRCTPIDQPIPKEFLGYALRNEEGIYPFTLIVGQEKIEEYVLEHNDSAFYNTARRMLKLPSPIRQKLHDADEKMVDELVLSVYQIWQEMRANDKEIDRIMSIPSHSDLVDEVAAKFISSGHREKNSELASSIKSKIKRLCELGVKDEHRTVNIGHTPGLSLDVSAFIEWFERHMAKNT